MNTKDSGCGVVNGNVSSSGNLRKHAKVLGNRQAQQLTQQQPHKKQVRRRLHTSRPYQERLLNMAEARREIVTALKYHRAAMKQASEEQHQQHQHHQQKQQSLSLQPYHVSSSEQDGRFKSSRNPRIYPSCTTKFSNYKDDFSYSSFSPPPPSAPNSHTCPFTFPFPHPTPVAENPNFTLPNQTLGLNLNLHHFNNLEDTLFLNNNNNSSLSSYTSPSSSSPPPSVSTDQEAPSFRISQGEGVSSVVDPIESNASANASGGLHTAMDDEGMAEIRSIGEQYEMEWSDTMSLVTSTWWFNFSKNMENDAHEVHNEDGAYLFDGLREFPAWLNNANESLCFEDCFQDPTLTW
ncbi:uncharacterized protein LOC113848509 [Abrus precatorius]|uniref:Uncharacterized protein LOC113848509 n=1 Tax=Abrus precatorius TaxID=3816 RepID=A0A8B8JQX5_ABRPR|nr:uncharacterized protein LOC113848509 [Abrus precatorius]